MPPRPDFIAHWSALENPEPNRYPDDPELQGFDASLGRKLGLTRIGIHHMRLPPGRRTSYPHAESAEEEFVFVIEGHPEVWIDGDLHRLGPGDSVAFPAGTGVCHTFLNNTAVEVRLIVVGERRKPENRVHYPLNAEFQRSTDYGWTDAPIRPLGSHDGMPRIAEAATAAGPRDGAERTARCACGALSVTARSEPSKISACHCQSCQRRTGSAFSVAVFYGREQVTQHGPSRTYVRPGDSGLNVEFHLCPTCGTSVFWYPEFRPKLVGVAIGCFAGDPPGPPTQSVYEDFRQDWVTIAIDPPSGA